MQETLIDITRLLHRFINKRLPTGVDRVSLAYIRHYGPLARAVFRHNGGKFVFRPAESATLFKWVLALGATGSPKPTIYKGLIAGCLMQNVENKFLFNTGHSGLESDDYVTMLREQKVRPLFMVHDLIPLTHPQFCRIGEKEKHFIRLRNAMQVASGIVCNSLATMEGLVSLCKEHRWLMPPTTVALLAPELPESTYTFRPVLKPYFVFVSTIEPRKNHLMILQLWLKLSEQMGDATPRLVIIGQRGWGFDEISALLKSSAVLGSLVTEISTCSDTDMVNYLKHAQAMVFPSFTEGYGMPVVEALVLGVPVIASDLAVFREFSGDIPEYVSVDRPDLWAQVITNYTAPDSTMRAAQMVRIKLFEAPTWSTHFSRVDSLLDHLALCH